MTRKELHNQIRDCLSGDYFHDGMVGFKEAEQNMQDDASRIMELIDQYVDWVIGEDEFVGDLQGAIHNEWHAVKNILRAEQRKRARINQQNNK